MYTQRLHKAMFCHYLCLLLPLPPSPPQVFLPVLLSFTDSSAFAAEWLRRQTGNLLWCFCSRPPNITDPAGGLPPNDQDRHANPHEEDTQTRKPAILDLNA